MASGATGTYGLPYPLQTDPVDVATDVQLLANQIETQLLTKANLASPTFTGTPAAPTASNSDNSTQIATTAFVKNQAYATISSPTFTGTTTIATLSVTGTISGSGLAGSLLSSATPQALGTASAGSSAIPSRQDHIHSNTNISLVTPTINDGDATSLRFIAPEEKWNVSTTAVTTSTTVDYLTAQNWYYTTASTAGACTVNIRGNSGTTLASVLANTNDSITLSFGITTGATTPAYFNAVNIDGTATGVTVRWQYGNTPTSGTTSGVDMYSFTVLKTGSGTYTVFASVCKW